MFKIGTYIWFELNDNINIYLLFLPIIDHVNTDYVVQLTESTHWLVKTEDIIMVGTNIDKLLYF